MADKRQTRQGSDQSRRTPCGKAQSNTAKATSSSARTITTPDMLAKVTGKSKYAEDFRAEGMLFCRLVLSPVPHGRIKRIDTDDALAMPGVKAILTADDIPAPAD